MCHIFLSTPDGAAHGSEKRSIILNCSHGTLRSLAINTALVSLGGNAVLFRGTMQKINEFLEAVEYWPDTNFHGTDSLVAFVPRDRRKSFGNDGKRCCC